ncbi:Nardilysin [Cricetulus griseus]|uniref:Nardilysin n=1 Tax=Cricetulus griseus TaxID=10029 RepID=G3GVY7_CRIGR|nr:Nardilysin [Cricetulus griseus]
MLRRVTVAAVCATGRKLWCEAGRELTALGRIGARGLCEGSAIPYPTLTMPGRNKAKSTCSCPDLQPNGQDLGEGGRVARLGADEAEEEGRVAPLSLAGDPEIIKSPSDPKQYRSAPLEHLAGWQVEEQQGETDTVLSAAALCVGVGSFADPDDLPGLAHFLEHMVFMGSLKYPDENGFDAFLKKHGGSDNASTDCERTVFQFDVQRKYFKEALDRCWALALFGGNGETGFEQNSTYSVFSISITLTDEGYEHFFEVAHAVFQYLKMLQELGPEKRVFEEIQKIEDNEFHYQEQTDPVEYVENMCENMQLYPLQDFLTGDQLLFEYKPEVIAEALNKLVPQKANLVLLSGANEGRCDLREKWFGTQYSIEDIENSWAELWKTNFDLNPDLHLPAENKYIATDFTLKPFDCPETEYPAKIVNTPQGCLWYKKDNKFKIPKAYIRFHLISPLIQKSAVNVVLFDIFVNILTHNLAEPAYEADVAQLEYKLVAGEHGLIIRVKGFNHKLPLLFQLIIDYLAEFSSTPAVFTMITEQLKKTYFNILIKPETLAKDVRLLILEYSRWSMIDKYRALMDGLSLDSLMNFVKDFKSQLFVEGLVQGNVTSTESMDFLKYVVDKLNFTPLEQEMPVQFQVVQLPSGHHLCKVRALNKGDANSEVTVYYQMHMEEPCFDFLRTKQTLGYHVYPTCRNTSGILGFSVTVGSQATKYNSETVDKKIEEFLSSFEEKIENLTEEAFNTQVTALIKLKECEDTHLGEEVDRNWNEVVTQQYLFDRLAHEIEALKSFSKSDLVSWFKAHRGPESKMLSVHVVGYGKYELEEDGAPFREDFNSGEGMQLTYLPPSSLLADSTIPITDIRAFTSTLSLFPYHKIVK